MKKREFMGWKVVDRFVVTEDEENSRAISLIKKTIESSSNYRASSFNLGEREEFLRSVEKLILGD